MALPNVLKATRQLAAFKVKVQLSNNSRVSFGGIIIPTGIVYSLVLILSE